MTPLLWVASLSLVGIGVVGILLPVVPGTPLIYIGLLLAAWADGFQYVSIGTMIFLGILTLVAFIADFVSGSLGAKRVGASRYTPNKRRCIVKVSQAVDFHLQCHQANSKKNTVKTCEFVLSRFALQFGKHDLVSMYTEEVLGFLLSMTKNNKQATKRNRYSVLASCCNFINTANSRRRGERW